MKNQLLLLSLDFKFPSDEELSTEECPLGTPYLRAGAFHLGKYCEAQNNEFVLCRHETQDPVKCLPEGKIVTSCTNEFFRKVKASCATSFTKYAMCLEQSSATMDLDKCRKTQLEFDTCMKETLGMDRPPFGYYNLIKVHESDRPLPEPKRPGWLDLGKPVDVLPQDFPRT